MRRLRGRGLRDPRRRRAVRRPRGVRPGLDPGRRPRARLAERQRDPGRCRRGLPVPRRPGDRRPGRATGSSASAPTYATPATPAPSSAPPTPRVPTPSCWRAPRSTPTTPRRSGPPSAACSTCRSRSSRDPLAAVAAARDAGLTVLAADGDGELDLDDADDAARPGPPPGCSATRPGACRPSWPPPPTTGSGSRSTAAPRASTSRPRPRSVSTRPRAPSAALGTG